MTSKFCGSCGKPLDNATNFCTHCGEPIKNSKNETKEIAKTSKGKNDNQVNFEIKNLGSSITVTERKDIAQRIVKILESDVSKGTFGEKLLWQGEEKQGVFKKPIMHYITNYRIVSYAENDDANYVVFPLNYVDVVIMNSHRTSSRTGIGGYTSLTKGMGIGGFQSSGKSVTIGDLIFLCQGENVATICNVADPTGLKNMVNQLKKTMKQNLKSMELSDEYSKPSQKHSRIDGYVKICLHCQKSNEMDEDICKKCGGSI